MKAKKKPSVKMTPKDLGIDTTGGIEILQVNEPPTRKGGVKVKNVDDLLSQLDLKK